MIDKFKKIKIKRVIQIFVVIFITGLICFTASTTTPIEKNTTNKINEIDEKSRDTLISKSKDILYYEFEKALEEPITLNLPTGYKNYANENKKEIEIGIHSYKLNNIDFVKIYLLSNNSAKVVFSIKDIKDSTEFLSGIDVGYDIFACITFEKIKIYPNGQSIFDSKNHTITYYESLNDLELNEFSDSNYTYKEI